MPQAAYPSKQQSCFGIACLRRIKRSSMHALHAHCFFLYGDGGIRTLVARKPNAFRVRPVMTASIRLQTTAEFLQTGYYYRIMRADSSNLFLDGESREETFTFKMKGINYVT